MYFSSILFLILFLPVTIALYYLVPGIKAKNFILLVASILFYAMGEPKYIFLLLACTIVNYALTMLMCRSKHRKAILAFIVVLNLGVLCFYKYAGLGLVLPIGISFYTFQMLSYCIDVYREPKLLQKNYLSLLLYVSFFPQLVAGPIVKYYDIKEQLEKRTMDSQRIAEGLRRFTYGLGKKVLISNTLGNIVDAVYAWEYSSYNAVIAWGTAVFYALQIYYDFSGYSDMAIGLGKMFGFDFKENFNYPYQSTTIKEFWRRWHMSLSTWFKEYLYIPLGGNRKGAVYTMINKYIVFFCTGLWHGANVTFVIWGLLHGTFSVLEEKGRWASRIKGTALGWLYAMVVVVIGFVFFRSDTVTQAVCIIASMFTGFELQTQAMTEFVAFFNPYVLCIVVLAVVGMFDWKTRCRKLLSQGWMQPILYIASVGCLLLCLMSLANNDYNPFIYFRF